jgi:hypothetical protein
MGPGLQPVSVMHVAGSKAQHGPDKGEGCAVLAHVPKARHRHGGLLFIWPVVLRARVDPLCHEQPNDLGHR